MADVKKLQKALSPLLSPLGKVYAGGMAVRSALYGCGVWKSASVPVPCIAVGNIAAGGTGKTPVVSWLLTYAAQKAMKSVVLTRGYGGSSRLRPLVVHVGTSPVLSGDEPLMLAQAHPESTIIADPDRTRALDYALREIQPAIVILDDGMQHMAVQRDLNLVLLRGEDLENGWNRVIPAGRWREGVFALKRADAFLLRLDAPLSQSMQALCMRRLKRFAKPIFPFSLVPYALEPLFAHAADAAEQIQSPDEMLKVIRQGYTVCTAVGTPASVLQSARLLTGENATRTYIFPDHHTFTDSELNHVMRDGLPCIVTAKDAVKIRPLMKRRSPHEAALWHVLTATAQFTPEISSQTSFAVWLERSLSAISARKAAVFESSS